MSEHNLWTAVRKGLVDAADLKIDLMRVENLVQDGPPDVNGCCQCVEFWIELKYADEPPARDSTKVFGKGGLRDSQIVWIYKRVKHGGRVWILAQCGLALFLVSGRYCRVFNEWTYPELLEFSTWYHVGKKRDWSGLLEVVLRGEI